MRPAPSPALSPGDRTGDRSTRRSSTAPRKARLRRISLEGLEPRTLLAVMPAPIIDPQFPFDITGRSSGTISGGDVFASAPTVTISRNNPNKMVATWVTHDPNAGNNPDWFVSAQFSIDAGMSWSNLPNLPGARIDPATGTNPLPFNAITHPSVTFDGNDNLYLLEIQHSDTFASGVVIVQPYTFAGNVPIAQATTSFGTWFQGGDATLFPNPQTAIRDAVIMADDTLATYTDPDTQKTQTNPGAGRVYIAWQTNMQVPTGYTGPFNPNTVELLQSTDQGATFSTPVVAGSSHFQNVSRDAAPRLAISQGRMTGIGQQDVPGGQVTLLYDDFTGGNNSSPPVDIIRAARFQPGAAGALDFVGRSIVATTTVRGAENSPFPLVTPATPGRGIGPGAVIAVDNTIGSFSATQGRIYVAYTDRYDTTRFGAAASSNQADNTDIFLRFSDNNGATWQSAQFDPQTGFPLPFNDDVMVPAIASRATPDGFSEAHVSFAANGIVGRSQFQPSLSVDPITGVLAVGYQDTRYDAARSRTIYSIQLVNGDRDGDGQLTSSPSVYADPQQRAFDQATFQNVVIGPIPSNTASFPDNGILGAGGIGDRQGLALNGGRLIAVYASNLNGLDDNTGASGPDRKYKIHVTPMIFQTDARVIATTQGPVSTRTVVDLQTGVPIVFNNQTDANGVTYADGFVVTFDTAIDVRTFTAADATVTYRSADGSVVTPITVTSVTPLDDGVTNIRNLAGIEIGTTQFLVRFQRFSGASLVGTYTYTVGTNINDFTRPTAFDTQAFGLPLSATTLPLQVAGPRVIRSFVPSSTVRTIDNLVTDDVVTGLNIVFDRDMDPTSLVGAPLTGNVNVLRLVTPSGTYANGSILPDGSRLIFSITAAPNSDPANPNSDPDTANPRTYRVNFLHIPAGSSTPVTLELRQSGSYTVTLASSVRSEAGDALDTNQNAGLDFLRGTPSAGTDPQTFGSQAPRPIGPGAANQTFTSTIQVNEDFLIQNVVVTLNIAYPRDPELSAVLVSPTGLRVRLFSNVGNVGTGQNFSNTILTDSADTNIADGGPPFSVGPYRPQEPLSQLLNASSAGLWQLEVTSNVVLASEVGQIISWSLTLDQPLSNSGLGEPVADRATESFRIFTLAADNAFAANTWTAVGPAGEGAKERGGNAEVAGRVGAIAVDMSDPSGNTVYVAGASGGVWKTSNFLTTDPTGPIYTPLTDNSPSFGLNISSIAVFPRNNDPNQSIIFASTGDVDAAGDPAVRGELTSRGVGFLRSLDGGATWTLLDSRDNTSLGSRDRFFASIPGQAGATSYKIVVDPRLTRSGEVVVYAALGDIDGTGQLATTGGKGGLWKSIDTGRTWTLMRAGQATDVVLDENSVNRESGNLDFLYAAFRGDGVYFSPNAAQNFNLMTGLVGNPLIQNTGGPQPQPVPVGASDTPNGKTGRIVLAKPAKLDVALPDLIYQGWLYAAVVNFVPGDPVETANGSTFVSLYMTKDFGQNWVKVDVPSFITPGIPELPSNSSTVPDIALTGSGTLTGAPFSLGNFALSLAVDPLNPNVVYVGGTSEFRTIGLIRVDTTGIHDAHAFYLGNNANTLSLRATTQGPVSLADATAGAAQQTPPFDPYATPNINLIRDPNNPFQANATILVQNTARFSNDGSNTIWQPFDQALAPNPFASSQDPWSVPTRNVHEIITTIDPLTGQSRFLFATDQGVYTAVADARGKLIGSLGGVESRQTDTGDVPVVNGSRNGNLAIAEVRSGASQPSQLSADLATLVGFFYSASQDIGFGQSDPDIINPGTAGYGNLSYNVHPSVNGVFQPTTNRGTGWSIQTQQTFETNGSGQTTGGTVYSFRISEDLVGLDFNAATNTVRPSTDTVQVNTVGRTFGLYQTSNGGNTPDAQFPFRVGSNVVVNPLSVDQMLISSQAGRIFSTTNRGQIWAEIGNPGALDSTYAPALTYGAPDPVPPGGGLGSLNNYILAGTDGGRIFVTFTGGGGNGNAWQPLSGGLDGSPVKAIVTNPTRGSREAYAVTERGVYHIADTRSGGNWSNVTGNLFSLMRGVLNNPSLGTEAALKTLTAVQADWRYLIPNDFANPTGPTHPMLYVAGEGGVFRSLDGGVSWGLFPDGAILADGTNNPNALLNSPLGQGGGLPNAIVTDLDLTLGIIDPVTGRAAAVTSGVQAPNLLTASTFGRGTYAIRLAPIVFPNTAANPAILRLSPTSPPPIGSDSGASSADGYTNVTTPVIEGLSEQSAFGNVVRIDVYDVSDYTPDEIAAVLAGRPTRPLGSSLDLVAGTQNTTSTGRFSAQIAPGHFIPYTNNATPNSDGFKKLLVQATNGSGTKGNFAALNFTLDTTPPAALVDGRTPAPGSPAPDLSPPLMDRPDLIAASDSGFSSSDNITNVTTNLTFTIPLAINEPSVTRVYLVRDSDSTIVDSQTGVAFPGTITLRDAGPVTEGTHTYYTYQEDLAGNRGPYSEKLTVRIDTTAPARPAAPVLDSSQPAPGGSDSNIVGDNITNVTLPYLTGLAEAGALVQIIDAGGNVLGPLLADAPNVPSNGIYSVRVVDPFIDGTYPLRVRVLDVAGNISETSVPLTVTILSAALAKPSLVLVAADDSGEVGDNITNVTRPRLVGVGTPGLNVQLLLVSSTVPFPGGVQPGGVITPTGSQTPVVVRPDGSFLLQFPTALPSGTYVVRARVSDIAANQEFSDNLTLQILTGSNPGDPNPPAGSPGQPTFALLPADDTGIKGDNITVSRRPRFVGNAYFADGSLAPNAVVELRTAAGQLLAVTTSTANGSYVLNLPNDLVNGRIDLQARIRDIAGNPGPGSTPITLRIVSVEGDADADSLADLESFSRVNSRFTLTNSNSPTVTTSPFLTQQGDIPLQGDFDGDGRTDFGFYRFGTGQWFVQQSRAGQAVFQFGLAGVDLPVQADYDGDGRTDFATWRQSDGTWTIFRSQTGTLTTAKFGVPGLDQPITGDFDGDRKTDLAVYRTSTGEWLASLSSGASSIPGTFLPPTSALPVPHTTWGIPNVSVPVTADYDGDGRTDLGVYVPALGTWYVARTTGGQQAIPLGQPNVDVPVPADYDGDGRADFAVFRPTDASWLILGSASPGRIATSGQVGDVPLLAPLQPYRYQPRSTAVVAARGVAVATGGSDFSTSATGGTSISTSPSTGVNLGGTAAKFASGGNTGKANANLVIRQRPRQTIQSQANAMSAAKANAHEGVVAQNSLYVAAMQKLGYLKVRFRKDV